MIKHIAIMEILGKLIGWVLAIGAAVGLYTLLKGSGRLENMGKWAVLERSFRTETMPLAYTYTSGMIGWYTYTGTLKIAFDSTGVFIDVPNLFRFGKKPIHIPYHELVVSKKNPTVKYGARTYTQFMVIGQRLCIEQVDAKNILARQAAMH